MSADGAVFVALMFGAVAVIACGWFLVRGRGNVGFDPPRVLVPGDELLPPATRQARGRRGGPGFVDTEAADEGARPAPSASSAEQNNTKFPVKDGL